MWRWFVALSVLRCSELGPNPVGGVGVDEDVFFEITSPPELEYSYRVVPARDFGAPFDAGFSLKGARLVPATPAEGCDRLSDSVRGQVALVSRGECSFLRKTRAAERAGARAIIITETEPDADSEYVEMIADTPEGDASIPAAFLSGRSGRRILDALRRLRLDHAILNIPVNMTFVPAHKTNQPPWVGW